MDITDNDLCVLEQLTYIDADVALAAGVSEFDGMKIDITNPNRTIEDYFKDFDKEALDTLRAQGDKLVGEGEISAEEWAGIIEYIQQSDLKDLVLADSVTHHNGKTEALCFTEKGNTTEAIVAFRGTLDAEEWYDNVMGLVLPKTKCDTEALDYIESLPYEFITATGHSKGARKAMYTGIRSDKVVRVVAFDGQGFSAATIKQYWAEIQEKSGIITEYSISQDYVHPLMIPVPGSTQIYCRGYEMDDAKQLHSPNSFFLMNGKGKLVLNDNGQPYIIQVPENESITMLHKFNAYVINNASEEDLELIANFLAKALEKGMGDADKKEMVNFILDNQDGLATVIAYLAKYMDDNDLTGADIEKLLTAMKLDSVNEKLTFTIKGKEVNGLVVIINYLVNNFTDNNDDPMISYALAKLSESTMEIDGRLDIEAFWAKINSKVKDINGDGGCADPKVKTGTVRDFSANAYNTLIDSINAIERSGAGNVSSWNSYSSEEWYGPLLVGLAAKAIQAYYNKLSETNQVCKTRINKVFDDVAAVDDKYAAQITAKSRNLQSTGVSITEMANNIIC